MTRVIIHREGYWTCESCGGPNRSLSQATENERATVDSPAITVVCHWCGVEYGVFPGIVYLHPRHSMCVEFDYYRSHVSRLAAGRGVDVSSFFRGAMEQVWFWMYDPVRHSPHIYRDCVAHIDTLCGTHLPDTVRGLV